MSEEYQWTVFYRAPDTQKVKREDFAKKEGKSGAVARVNELLRKGYKAWMRPYSPPRRYIDIVAERGPNG